MTSASSLKSRPETPRTKTSGTKMTRVVMVLATIAPATSPVPRTAASSGASPSSVRRRKTFSSTTTELSTIIPTPRASPPSVIRLRVSPCWYISAKVATTETGMAAVITRVLRRLRRKSSSTSAAKAPP